MRKKSIIALATALMSVCLYTQPIQTYIATAADTETPIISELPETDEISSLAVSKLDDLSDLFALFTGATAYTEATTDTTTDGLLLKVTDARFKSIESIKSFINATCCDALKNTLTQNINECFVEKTDALYVKRRLTSYLTIPTSKGVCFPHISSDEFTAVTEDYTEMNGYAKAVFHNYEGDWYIESVEFIEDKEQLEYLIISRMEELSKFIGILVGAPGYVDSKDFITVNGSKYFRLKNVPFSNYDELKACINNFSTGQVSESLISDAGSSIIIENEKLYVKSKAISFPIFMTENGIKITSQTDTSFTATTTIGNELYGKGTAYFILKDGRWLIDKYEFGAEENDDLNDVAIQMMKDLNLILAIINASPQYTERIDDEYSKITDTRFETLYDFHVLVEKTVAGDLRQEILVETSETFTDINGALCVKCPARSYYSFITDEGVNLSDIGNGTFSATTVASSDLYGKGTAYFTLEDGLWYISKYEFGSSEQPAEMPLGDINGDAKIDAKDASVVLVEYSKMSTGEDTGLTDAQKSSADVNNDGKIDAKDSSVILAYYSVASTATGEVPTLQEFVASQG